MMNIEDREQIWELNKKVLQSGATVKIQLSGTSMFPYLKKNDIGYYQFIAPELLQKGDIVAFEQHENFITHRLIKISNSNLFLTRGDACIDFDKTIGASAIIGKLIKIERNGKLISLITPYRNFLHKLFATHRIFIRLYAKFI